MKPPTVGAQMAQLTQYKEENMGFNPGSGQTSSGSYQLPSKWVVEKFPQEKK